MGKLIKRLLSGSSFEKPRADAIQILPVLSSSIPKTELKRSPSFSEYLVLPPVFSAH